MAILPPDPVYIMRGDMGPVHSLLFRVSPYIEHLYAGAESGRIHIWDLRRNREIFKLDASNEACLAMHTMSDEYLITQRKGGAINLWQPRSSSWVISETVETDYSGFCRAQVSTEDELFIPLNDSKIGLFSLKTLKTEIELNPLSLPDAKSLGMVMAIKPYIDESKYVLVAYDGGLVYMWDMRTKKMLSSLEVEQCPMAIDFSPTLMTGIVGSPCNNLQIFTLSNGNELSEKTRLPLKNPGISAIAIRPDAKTFATGGWDSRIRIYSWKTLRPLVVLDQPHRATIHDIVYSSCKVEAYNSKCLMAAAGKDGNISLWDLYN